MAVSLAVAADRSSWSGNYGTGVVTGLGWTELYSGRTAKRWRVARTQAITTKKVKKVLRTTKGRRKGWLLIDKMPRERRISKEET